MSVLDVITIFLCGVMEYTVLSTPMERSGEYEDYRGYYIAFGLETVQRVKEPKELGKD